MRLPLEIRLPPASAREGASSTFAVDPTSQQPLLIELQGSLEADGSEGDSVAGAVIGQLDLSQPSRPQLLISHHLLTGKVVKLEKPLAVLKHTFPPSTYSSEQAPVPIDHSSPSKSPRRDNYTSSPDAFRNASRLVPPETPVGNGVGKASSSPLPTSPATPSGVIELREGAHEIVGIIRTKLLFSQRPQNITHLEGALAM